MTALDETRILDAAMALADQEGIEPLTIRRLASVLGVGAMSIYHYLPNKDAILDAMVDRVFSEIEVPDPQRPWREALEARTVSMREVLRRHPWAVGQMNARRNPGPASLLHHESVLACLRGQGFSLPATSHTFALLDAYVYGFAVQAESLPFSGQAELQDLNDELFTPEVAATFPRMAEFARDHALQPGYTFEAEFQRGLEVVLDGIERAWAP